MSSSLSAKQQLVTMSESKVLLPRLRIHNPTGRLAELILRDGVKLTVAGADWQEHGSVHIPQSLLNEAEAQISNLTSLLVLLEAELEQSIEQNQRQIATMTERQERLQESLISERLRTKQLAARLRQKSEAFDQCMAAMKRLSNRVGSPKTPVASPTIN